MLNCTRQVETGKMADTKTDPNLEKHASQKSLPDDALPPVEAPNSGFIIQLFVIPLIIVAIIITIGFTVNWIAQSERDPKDLVKGLRKGDDASWQKAENLTTLLRDPNQDHLKYDTELAGELVLVLKDGMEAKNALEGHQILMRCYLCRAMGEFKVPTVLPALLKAATTERDSSSIEPRDPSNKTDLEHLTDRKRREVDVRQSALEGITVLIGNLGADTLADNDELLEVLLAASRESGDLQKDEYLRLKLRSAAAMALGSLGGEEALDRLNNMQEDGQAHVRYNAATGLARNGDPRCVDTLLEMLDPDNDEAVKWDFHETGKERTRAIVLHNGIKATLKLAQRNKDADVSSLVRALQQLRDSDLSGPVRLGAKEALLEIQQR
jgi:hypothetical protein